MVHDLSEFGATEIIGCVLVALSSTLAITVGLGGGSLYIPILLLLMDANGHEATAISQCMMAGASLATFLVNIKSRHPNANRPLLNLDLALIMSPLQLAGTLWGVVVNRLTPAYVILVIMVIVMISANILALRRGLKLRKSELGKKLPGTRGQSSRINTLEKDLEEMISISTLRDTLDATSTHTAKDDDTELTMSKGITHSPTPLENKNSMRHNSENEYSVNRDKDNTSEEERTATLSKKAKKDQDLPTLTELDEFSKNIFWNPFDALFAQKTLSYFVEAEQKQSIAKWILVVSIWCMNFVFSLVRGTGKGSLNLIVPCSTRYWLVLALNCLCLVAFGLACSCYCSAAWQRKLKVNFVFVKGDGHLNLTYLSTIALGSFLAGFYGGMAGVGGGVILTPLLLLFSTIPQVIACLNAFLILLSSSAASVIYLFGNALPYQVTAVLTALSFVFSFVGKLLLDKWVKKHESPSVILLTFAVLLFIAITSTAGVSINSIINGEASNGGVALLCASHDS